jgi:cytochrome c oxidase subunit IV
MSETGHGHGHVNRKSYWIIFGVLFFLTVLEVGVAHPSLGISKTPMMLALVSLALVKAALVAYFFMHLKHEMKALKLTVLLPFFFPALYAIVLIFEAVWRLAPPELKGG